MTARNLERQKPTLADKLVAAEGRAPPVILHSSNSELYKVQVAELIAALYNRRIGDKAIGPIQSLIDRVVLVPDPTAPSGLYAEFHGDLAMFLSAAGGASGALNAAPAWFAQPSPFLC
jgi:hypothetical protein